MVKRTSFLLLFPLLTLVVVLLGSGVSQEVKSEEVDALIQLFDTFNGLDWINRDGWNSSFTGHCNWYGVLCDTDSRKVVEILLSSNGLSGDFETLEQLNVTNELTSLTTLDLSGNLLTGTVPLASLLAFPAIDSIDVSDNKLTDFPLVTADLQAQLATVTLSTLLLSENRYWCPIPTYITSESAIAGNYSFAATLDVNTSSCIRTKTVTVFRSETLLVDAPVPVSDIFNVSRTLDRLYIRSYLNVSSASAQDNVSYICTDIMTRVAEAAEAVGGSESFATGSYSTPPYFFLSVITWKDVEWLELDFSVYPAASHQDQRVDLALRFRFSHASIRSLFIRDFWWLYEGETLATSPPLPTVAPVESVADNADTLGLFVAGVVLLILLVIVACVALACRQKAYAPKPSNGPQFYSMKNNAQPTMQPPPPGQVVIGDGAAQSGGMLPQNVSQQQPPHQMPQMQIPASGLPPPGFGQSGHLQQQPPPGFGGQPTMQPPVQGGVAQTYDGSDQGQVPVPSYAGGAESGGEVDEGGMMAKPRRRGH